MQEKQERQEYPGSATQIEQPEPVDQRRADAEPAVQAPAPVPGRRIAIAAALVAAALLIAWLSALASPRNPNPFSGPPRLASADWWLMASEADAELRLPVIETRARPESLTLTGRLLLIGFDDGTAATLDADDPGRPRAAAAGGVGVGSGGITIPFDFDSSSVNPQAQALIDDLMAAAGLVRGGLARDTVQQQKQQQEESGVEASTLGTTAPDAYRFVLEGHTLAEGPAAYNLALSERMAYAVRDYLTRIWNVPPSNITVTGYGESRPAFAEGDDRNRRVELKLSPAAAPGAPFLRSSLDWSGATLTVAFLTAASDKETFRVSAGEPHGVIQHRSAAGTWTTIATTRAALDAFPGATGAERASVGPAPLALLAALALAAAAVLVLAAPPPPSVTASPLVDYFASDAPISHAGEDRLRFGPIAKSLSQFLRNQKTAPPLTVAVVGPWGTGKSSLMKLLGNDLRAHRLRPVWVNAWHHQNESQFLAGLLERVRVDALPPTFSAANLLFQCNLFWRRARARTLRSVLALALLLVPIGYWMSTGSLVVPEALWSKAPQQILAGISPLMSALSSIFLLMLNFGTRIDSLTGNTVLSRLLGQKREALDLRAMVGLREQFIAEFETICDALAPTTLTIFIDDLDRCAEARILDVLETVNFLVTSGQCYVVLGMERGPVERAIANHYRPKQESRDEEALVAHARRYLEKLLNIEVPVPAVSDGAYTALIEQPGAPTGQRLWLRWTGRAAISATIAAALLGAGMLLGTWVAPQSLTAPDGAPDIPAFEPIDPPVREPDVAPEPPATPDAVAVATQEPLSSMSGVVLALLGLLAIGGIVALERYRQRQHSVVTDSNAFRSSLSRWGDAISDLAPSPRRLKRFVNRTRYLAMRANNTPGGLDEAGVVTLAAIQEIEPALLASPQIDDAAAVRRALADRVSPARLAQVEDLIDRYCSPANRQGIASFQHWVSGIAIR